MAEPIGTLLWEMRTAKCLSLGQLARSAGLSKATLSQWETGKRVPRVPELETALEALQASAAQRARAFAGIEAPRALRHLRGQASTTGLTAPPTAGDLLRAMRLRKGWTQEQVSAPLGVQRHTLARWEQGERMPSTEQLQALCYVLEAAEEELVALTTGRFADSPIAKSQDWDEVRESLREHIHISYHLPELYYFLLEREAWEWATRKTEARAELAQLYAHHASFVSLHARWQEVPLLAQKAIALLSHQAPNETFVRATIALAGSAVYSGHQIAPERGIQWLKPLMHSGVAPEYQAWILADIARYASLSGDVEASLSFSEAAKQRAEQCDNPSEAFLRRVDQAWVHIQAGCCAEGLNKLPDPTGMCPQDQVACLLVSAEAYLQMGNFSPGHDRLQQAQNLIAAHQVNHQRARAEGLAMQF